MTLYFCLFLCRLNHIMSKKKEGDFLSQLGTYRNTLLAVQLYSSIGFGCSLQAAFDQAKTELLLENIPGENIPQLYARNDVDLKEMILVRPEL